MGKKNRHSQDRMFITATEWAREYGGKKHASSSNGARPLPFDHCALSLGQYETPVCTSEGVIFDLVNLVPYIQKYHSNPITGAPMTTKDIIRLNMDKNAEGKWHCPVTCKVFNNNTKIAAIKSTGNVYCYDAIYELNIKPRHFVDLLTNEPFQQTDIIILQDPNDPQLCSRRDISTFVHLNQVREDIATEKSLQPKVRSNPVSACVMKEMDRLREAEEDRESKFTQMQTSHASSAASRIFLDDVKELLELGALTEDVTPGQVITSGKAGCSLTSTLGGAFTDNDSRPATAEELREARWRAMRKLGKKAHIQIQTSVGNINIELHCDMAQRTCWNFITLALKGYFSNTTFHRLVPGFMVQGGDPTGTGTGGTSAWGEPFKDEFDSRLWHESRGVVSMANRGPNTNTSQFFITLGKAEHLNNLHSVFGRVVGGMVVLDRIEAIGCDKKEKPLSPINVNDVVVFTNPIPEADEILMGEIRERMAARKKAAVKSALPSQALAISEAPVVTAVAEEKAAGSSRRTLEDDKETIDAFLNSHHKQVATEQPKKKAKGFGNFSNW